MDEPKTDPLTVAEAKRRLRRAAESPLAADLIRRHPLPSLALAFAAGVWSERESLAGKPYLLAWLVRKSLPCYFPRSAAPASSESG